jgi:hypothetical protein
MAFAGTWPLEGPELLAQPTAPAINIDAAIAKKFPQSFERSIKCLQPLRIAEINVALNKPPRIAIQHAARLITLQENSKICRQRSNPGK